MCKAQADSPLVLAWIDGVLRPLATFSLLVLAIASASAAADATERRGGSTLAAAFPAQGCAPALQRQFERAINAPQPIPQHAAERNRFEAASSCGPHMQVLIAHLYLLEGDLQAAWQWRFAATLRSALLANARPELWRGEGRARYATLSDRLDAALGSFDDAGPIMTLRAFEAMLAWESAQPSPLVSPESYPEEYAAMRDAAERARDAHAAAMGLP